MTKSRPALEFKGRMLSITRVRILDDDPTAIEAQLKTFTRSLGEAAEGLPLLLDADSPVSLGPVVAAMRAAGLQPIAAVHGVLTVAAREAGLAVLSADMLSDAGSRGAGVPREAPAAPARAEPVAAPQPIVPAVRKPARVVTDPIRSGQQSGDAPARCRRRPDHVP